MEDKKSKKPKRVQSKNWVFTLNNYTLEEEFLLMFDMPPTTYIIFGYEVGDQENTPHLQGYFEVDYRIDMNVIKTWPGYERMHLESRKGSQKQAIEYCKKQGNWFECGTPYKYKMGHRKDLDDARRIALEKGMKNVAPWANLQAIRTAEKYLEYNEPGRNWKPIVTWLWGETGVGKSRMAHDIFPDAYTKADGSKWWNGYDRHESVIWDDFREDDVEFNNLLRLLDRYECRIETKGGMRQFVPKHIIITSRFSPYTMYHTVGNECKMQLLRRLDIVQEVGGNTSAPTSP